MKMRRRMTVGREKISMEFVLKYCYNLPVTHGLGTTNECEN